MSISTPNKDQKFAYNLVINTLSDYLDCTDNCENFRMSVAGLAGSGKSFPMKCLVQSIRKLFNSNKAVQVLCPTVNSANLISGVVSYFFENIFESANYIFLKIFLKVPTKKGAYSSLWFYW